MKAFVSKRLVAIMVIATLSYSAGCGSDDAEVGPSGVDKTKGQKGGAGGSAGKAGSSGSAGKAGTAGKGGTTSNGLTDPCNGVPAKGVCKGTTQVQYCSTPTGQGKSKVVTTSCKALEECQVVSGQAKCVAKAGLCEPNKSECVNSTTARLCDQNGAWSNFPCANCAASAFGATCNSSTTSTLSGTVAYEYRSPDSAYQDWSTDLYKSPAPAMLVMTAQYDSAKKEYVPLQTVITDGQGSFTIQKPANPGPEDLLVVFPAYVQDNKILFTVVQPNVPDGEYELNQIPEAEQYWQWAWKLGELKSGTELLIDEPNGSGVVRLYDSLRFSYLASKHITGKAGKSLAVWMRYNTSFDCGDCFTDTPGEVLSETFDSQVFVSATQQDQGYWSLAMSAHEFGHWAMAAYGTRPGEGGTHYLGCATPPGMAWSEGWATWFSCAARNSPIDYDKQQGSFFHLNIDTRSAGDSPWPRPSADDGLLQNVYELEISTMLWKMTSLGDANSSVLQLPANKIFFDALQSTRMNQSPFGRGYTRRSWDVVEGTCDITNVQDSGESVPMFADFLDALRCAGMSAATVDKATEPAQHYPYPSSSPVCQ